MSDIVDGIVSEVQSMASGKSKKGKKKGAKKGGDPMMNLLIAAGVVGVGYLIYKNSSGSASGSGDSGVSGIIVPNQTSLQATVPAMAAGAEGPEPVYTASVEAVYF